MNEPKRSWAEWAVIRMLKVGPIPRHVAFIMDGNRRFARQVHKDTLEGHSKGFEKLTEVLSWCRDLGITEVTVYAFSIENFKRSKAEVDGLLKLSEEKFELLIKEIGKLNNYGIRIRVIGRTELLTQKLQKLIAEAVLTTKNNDKYCLNLALAYTSREEITTASSDILEGCKTGRLFPQDVTEELLEQCLYTEGRRDPDLLIRTSGEVRLSDFLLWQSSLTHLFFTKVLWPQISIWHVFAAVFHYQRHHHSLLHLRQEDTRRRARREEESDQQVWSSVEGNASYPEFIQSKRERQRKFVAELRAERLNHLNQMMLT